MYERAVSNTPPGNEKRYWQRYIYLWINYALYEELEAEDAERTREVYRICLKLIPHKLFTFAKVPMPPYALSYQCTKEECSSTAHVCQLQTNVPVDKMSFASVVRNGQSLCSSLSEHDINQQASHSMRSRLRTQVWLMAAQFEIRQLRLDAARKILGLAIGMCPKDKIFNTYIHIELQLGNFDRCRKLYERYLEWAPDNCTAWGKFAELEKSLGEAQRCRAIFELAIAQPVLDMPEVLWKVGCRCDCQSTAS